MKHFYFYFFLVSSLSIFAQVDPVCFNSLISANTLSAGVYPMHICTADFNSDGKADLAVANMTTNNVSVFMGAGAGAFAAPVNYASVSNGSPWSICSADFNSDGHADLVTTNITANNLSVFFGSPTGTFAAGVTYGTGGNASRVRADDFNSDGHKDLAVMYSNNMNIMMGSSTGTFGTPVTYNIGSNAQEFCIADFNGDGYSDLAVSKNNGSSAAVLIGSSTGTFATPVSYMVGTAPNSIVSADFNTDGFPDIAVSTYSAGLYLLAGSSTGTFAAAVNFSLGTGVNSMVHSDFNGDGKADLAISYGSIKSIRMLLGNGAATFTSTNSYMMTDYPYYLITGDFNGDGIPDLANTTSSSNKVTVVMGTGTGALTAATAFGSGAVPFTVKSADFNGDGIMDLVTTNYTSASISVLLAQSNSSFFPAVSYTVGNNPTNVTSADFNGDGHKDLAVNNFQSASVSILLGSATGTFAAATNIGTGGLMPTCVISSDFNSDGNTDLAITNGNTSNVAILLGTGGGSFLSPVVYTTVVGPYYMASADFNADGNKDLAITGSAFGNLHVLLGSSTGTFSSGGTYTVGTFPYGLVIADFNNDAKDDIVVANYNSNNVSLLLGNGTGGFGTHTTFVTGSGPHGITSADYNMDGIPDVAVTNYLGTSLSVLLCTGTASFLAPTNFVTGPNPRSVLSHDFNADGKMDLAVANMSSDNVSILLNASPTVSLSSAATVCAGNSLMVTAYGANSYSWSSGALTNTVSVSPVSNTTYTVYGKSFGGCMGTASKAITVNTSPLPTVTVNSGTICSGQSFSLNPSGADVYSITGGQAVVTPTANKTYTVVGTNTLTGCYSGPVISGLTVNITPTVTASSGTICAGQSYTIITTGAPNYTIQGGSAVVSPLSSASYTVTGTSTAGCVSQVALSNVPVFPLPTVSVNSGAICIGNSFTLVPSGAPSYSYGAGSAAIVSPVVNASYNIYGLSNIGCVSAAAVSHVTVMPLPVILISGNSFVCQGLPLSLIANGTAASYSWSNGMTGNLITFTPAASGIYSVTGTVNSCTATVTKSITVLALPVITVNSGSVCLGQPFDLNPSGAFSYTGSSLVYPAVNGTFSIMGTDPNGCVGAAVSTVVVYLLPQPFISSNMNGPVCAGDAETLQASGGIRYYWTTGDTTALISITPTVTTSYTVTAVAVNGCTNSIAFTKQVEPCLFIPQRGAFRNIFSIYPNPGKGDFVLESSETAFVKITNALGQLLLEMQVVSGKNEVDLSALPDGVYFMNVIHLNQSQTIRLIKQ